MIEELELNCKTNFSKISDIPKIIYLNYDKDIEKRDYMESQFLDGVLQIILGIKKNIQQKIMMIGKI